MDFTTPRPAAMPIAAGILLLTLVCAAPGSAQEVPRMNYIDVSHFVATEVFSGTFDRDEAVDDREANWSREVSASLVTGFGAGSAEASVRNEVTDLGFRSRISCAYEGNVGTSNLDVQSRGALIVAFTVDQPVVGTLRGTVELGGASGVQVLVNLRAAGVDFMYGDDDLGGGTIAIDEPVFLEAGTFYFAGVEVFAGDVFFDAQTFGNVDVDITLDIGDRDRDGLPDVWERDGIDFDGDGIPEIPLSGADPDRKDLFVEVDVQQSSTFPRSDLSLVRNAFANAPVDNPDGSTGITLHTEIDERSLPDLVYTADEASLKSAVASQKQTWFGTAAERAEADWESEGRDFKRRAYRYCVLGGSQTDGASGYGEIPGNDFIITTDSTNFDNWLVQDQVSTFMHELGHTLGLRHGGDDNIQFKPNYVSVMNYTFQAPSMIPNVVGWTLDYSRSVLPSLDESALSEASGILGDPALYSGRTTLINAAPSGSSRNLVYPGIGDGADVDFDGDADVPESSAVEADLNHIDRSRPASPGETLRGHEDWQNIHLSYSGHPNFDAGVAPGLTSADPDIGSLTTALFDALQSAAGGPVTSVDPDTGARNEDFRLALPQPNPSNGPTTLAFSLARDASVEVVVHDVRGRRVATLAVGERAPGSHQVVWNGRDDGDHPVGSGQYFAVLRIDGEDRDVKKITLVR